MSGFWETLSEVNKAATLSLVNNLRMAGTQALGFDRGSDIDSSQRATPGNIEHRQDLAPQQSQQQLLS